MKFLIYKLSFGLSILLLYLDYSHQTQLVEVFGNALDSGQANVTSVHSLYSVDVVNANETITFKTPLRKRKHFKKKRKTQTKLTGNSTAEHAGITPSSVLTPARRKKKKLKSATTSVTLKYPDLMTTLYQPSIRRNLKKRRRRRKKQKNNNSLLLKVKAHSSDNALNEVLHIQENQTKILEPGNLVLPVWPEDAQEKKAGVKTVLSTCGKLNGGCTHICLAGENQKCACFKGFRLDRDGKNCIDIDECAVNNGDCEANCTNTIGSYKCHCPVGLRLSLNLKSCDDINECRLRNGHGPCQDTCTNTFGGYKCSCNRLRGTKLSNDLHTCIDVDECAIDNGGCSHICINAFGRSFCSCPEGMQLSSDFRSCNDINECELDEIQKSCPTGCLNLEGSYKCLDISDIQNDEVVAKTACKPLYPPPNGYYKCSRKHAVRSFSPKGRRRVKNSVGTQCILVCPDGYRREGKGFHITCGINGIWFGNFHARCISNHEHSKEKEGNLNI